MARRFYKPGSAGYDADRAKELRRQRTAAKQALTAVRRAKAPKAAIDRAKRRQARIQRELASVTARQEVRKGQSEENLRAFSNLGFRQGVRAQTRFAALPPGDRNAVLAVLARYPDPDRPIPKDEPDPYANSSDRNGMWAITYSSRRKRRNRPRRVRQLREAA